MHALSDCKEIHTRLLKKIALRSIVGSPDKKDEDFYQDGILAGRIVRMEITQVRSEHVPELFAKTTQLEIPDTPNL